MKKIKILVSGLAVFSAMLLNSCSTTGPAYTRADVPAGKAVIYLYRPASFTLSKRTIFMAFPDDKHSYSMTNGGYYPLIVSPGTVFINAVGTDIKPVLFKIDIKKGEERFVVVRFASTLALLVPAEFEEVSEAAGRKEISKCSLISRSK